MSRRAKGTLESIFRSLRSPSHLLTAHIKSLKVQNEESKILSDFVNFRFELDFLISLVLFLIRQTKIKEYFIFFYLNFEPLFDTQVDKKGLVKVCGLKKKG